MYLSFIEARAGRAKIVSDSDAILSYLEKMYTVDNPRKRFMRHASSTLSCISGSMTIKVGMILDFIQTVKIAFPNIKIKMDDEIRDSVFPINYSLTENDLESPETNKIKYRDYQATSIVKALRCGRGIFELATSAGKSLIIYGIIKNIWKCDGKISPILICVPNIQLVSQMKKEFIEEYGYTGQICMFTATADKKYNNQPIIIANRTFLSLHYKEIEAKFRAIIIDECHTLQSVSYCNVINSFKCNVKIGFTGTLPTFLPDLWSIKGECGPILSKMLAKELQDQGFSAKVKITAIRFNHNHILRPPDDLQKAYANAIKEGKQEIADLIIKEIAKEMFPIEWNYIESVDWATLFIIKVLLKFTGNIVVLYDHTSHGMKYYEYAKNLCPERRVYIVKGDVHINDREDIRSDMEKYNNCFLIGNTKCFGTGINIKNIDTIALAFSAGYASTKVIQAIGRGLRLTETKTHVNIIDFFHSFKFSSRHFNQRKALYNKHYGVKDVTIQNISVPSALDFL